MEKKILSIFVCMLLFVTVLSVTGNEIVNESVKKNVLSFSNQAPATKNLDAQDSQLAFKLQEPPNIPAPLSIWALQFSFNVEAASGAAGNTGVEWDGDYFYTCRWQTNLMHQYNRFGDLVKEFSIPGVYGSRDFAYNDGNGLMYSGTAGTTLYEFNVFSETLFNSYPMPVTVRALAYDSDEDAFWCNNWGNDITCVKHTTGTILYTISNTISLYGLAFDNVCGEPTLWLFSGTSPGSSGCQVQQYINIYSGGTLGPQSHTVGSPGTWIAGGAGFTDSFIDGYSTLMVLGQGDGNDDTIFCYEICSTLPPCPIQIGDIYVGTSLPTWQLETIFADVTNTGSTTTIPYTMTFTFSSGYIATRPIPGSGPIIVTLHYPPSGTISGSVTIGGGDTEQIGIRVSGTACFDLTVEAGCADPKTVHGCAGLAICS